MGEYAQAIADNKGEADSELVFQVGDIIHVISKNTGASGWWEGECNEKTGFFPESFVSIIDLPGMSEVPELAPIPPTPTSPPPAQLKKRGKVLFDFNSEIEDDLPVKVFFSTNAWNMFLLKFRLAILFGTYQYLIHQSGLKLNTTTHAASFLLHLLNPT